MSSQFDASLYICDRMEYLLMLSTVSASGVLCRL